MATPNPVHKVTSPAQMRGKFPLHVSLNGTAENPYHRFGLTCNPFPQLAKAGYEHVNAALQKLAADPIPHDSAAVYIAGILAGWDQEFIDLCVGQFKPGEIVDFIVYIPGV